MRSTLPEDLERRELILELARRLALHPAVERVWLFGSRARGDNFPRSDIDLAIEAPGIDRDDWAEPFTSTSERTADRSAGRSSCRWTMLPESFRHRYIREGGWSP